MTKEPLTPPPQDEDDVPRKPSVSFDLSNLPDPATPAVDEEALLSPTRSIDIAAHAVPDTICVSLLDRDTEMRQLVAHNAQLFNTLRSHLFKDWPRFENTLYVPRRQIDDLEWMARISKALQPVPSLLQQFRDLVGYIPHSPPSTASPFDHVELLRIRAHPDKLKQFPAHYPQFFVNCQTCLQDEQQAFEDTLFSSTLPDDVWETTIYNQLDRWPDLVAQLKEIVAYETEQH
ncbi:hypothetical protein BJV82DRAFT_662041 [Fennellomyces sp. T-0311]|nr:hypothetical protein BJV82DRAFT_662041 [Fennellomyces sp. T-0311]